MIENKQKHLLSRALTGIIVTLKEDGISECEISVEVGCGKQVAHNALSYFTKLGIFWDEKRTCRPRITSAIDYTMMKFCFFY